MKVTVTVPVTMVLPTHKDNRPKSRVHNLHLPYAPPDERALTDINTSTSNMDTEATSAYSMLFYHHVTRGLVLGNRAPRIMAHVAACSCL